MNCKFCDKVCKNHNSLINHERLCKQNTDSVMSSKTQKWYDAMSKRKGHAGTNQFIKARENGLPLPVISEETRQKNSEAAIKFNKVFWTEERKKAHSEIMKQKVEQHNDSYTKNNVCGRVKNIEYDGIMLKGQWELKLAIWLDSQNIRWEYESSGFPYEWSGSTRTYFPDFFIPSLNFYIEVKGYKTERDEAKWNNFPNNLAIVDKITISKLNSFVSVEDFLVKTKYPGVA